MTAHIYRLVLTASLFFLAPYAISAQCSGTCPNNDGECNAPECCIVDTGAGGNSISECISMGATTLRVKVTSTINSGNISGVKFCLDNNDLIVGENVIVDNTTCFEANGSFGVSVAIGGTTFTFNNNDGGLADLNTAIANLSSGSTIGSVAASLPVTLKSFSASPLDGRQIMIEWTTSVESDNDYFLLDHSTDGKTFQRLRTIDSYGNSETEQKYSYLHQVASGGDQYYRLSQYDLDGSFASLGLTQVKLVSDGQIPRLYPNPISAGQEIRLSGVDQLENTSCTLHNMIGQSWPLQNTGERLQLPANLPAGKYFLRVISGSIATSIPLQIQ